MSIFTGHKYPYTDFHELNLDWLIAQSKDLEVDWDAFKKGLEEQWDSTKTELENLIDYAKEFFKDLDVQEEVNNKIDAMYNEGIFNDYFLKECKVVFPVGNALGTASSGNCAALVFGNIAHLFNVGSISGGNAFAEQLHSIGVTTINSITITCWTSDNYGGLGSFVNKFSIPEGIVLYVPGQSGRWRTETQPGLDYVTNLLPEAVIVDLSTDPIPDWSDSIIDINYKNNTSALLSYYESRSDATLNDTSVIVELVAKAEAEGTTRVLLTGDIGPIAEEKVITEGIVNKTYDIITYPNRAQNSADYHDLFNYWRPQHLVVQNNNLETSNGYSGKMLWYVADYGGQVYDSVSNYYKDNIIFLINAYSVTCNGNLIHMNSYSNTGINTFYVDPNVADTAYMDGTIQHPFKWMKKALMNAKQHTTIELLNDSEEGVTINYQNGYIIINGNNHSFGTILSTYATTAEINNITLSNKLTVGRKSNVTLNNVTTTSATTITFEDSTITMNTCELYGTINTIVRCIIYDKSSIIRTNLFAKYTHLYFDGTNTNSPVTITGCNGYFENCGNSYKQGDCWLINASTAYFINPTAAGSRTGTLINNNNSLITGSLETNTITSSPSGTHLLSVNNGGYTNMGCLYYNASNEEWPKIWDPSHPPFMIYDRTTRWKAYGRIQSSGNIVHLVNDSTSASTASFESVMTSDDSITAEGLLVSDLKLSDDKIEETVIEEPVSNIEM